MALDRWIALVILLICLIYGYVAFFTMDGSLPPFMRRNPVWPSTFPKILAVAGALTALIILLGFEKHTGEDKAPEINYRRLQDYKLGQALLLLALMVAYALLLRPIGFLAATILFLYVATAILGERRWVMMLIPGLIATLVVWFLVQVVLDVYLLPLPQALVEENQALVRGANRTWDGFIDLFGGSEAAPAPDVTTGGD